MSELAALRKQVEELERQLCASDRVIHAIELGGERWSSLLMEYRDEAVNRHRALLGKKPLAALPSKRSGK